MGYSQRPDLLRRNTPVYLEVIVFSVGDLVLDKEFGELAVVIEIRNALYVVRSLETGCAYPVPCGWASDELEKIE